MRPRSGTRRKLEARRSSASVPERGCVRSTSESAHNLNFHTIVAAEAVGDRHPLAHEANLTDIDLRFGDVTPVEDVIAYLRKTAAQPEKALADAG